MQIKSRLESGFTLIELVLIISILGIISVKVSPKFFSQKLFDESAFLQDTLASLKYAQKLALNSGCHVQANLSTSQLTLNFRDNCTTGNFTTPIKNPGLNQPNFVKLVPKNVVVSASNMPLYFDSAGSIHVVSSDVIQDYTVQINSLSLKLIGQSGLMYAV